MMIKKWIITLCVSVLLIAESVGSADAYTATVSYFFEGIDLDTGEVYHDPTVLVVFQGDSNDIDEILKPDDFMPDFDPNSSVDVHFEYDPTNAESPFSVVSDLKELSMWIAIIDDPNVDFDDVTLDFLRTLESDDWEKIGWSDSLAFGPEDILIFRIPMSQYIWALELHPYPYSGLKPLVLHVKPVIPEPSTLLLLGLGLFGLVGLGKKWRRKGKRGLKGAVRLLLLMIIGAMAGVLLLSGIQPVAAQDNTCEINLQNNTHTCDTVSAISFIDGPTAGTLANEVVIKITLGPNTTGYTKARFDIEYGGPPTGYTVNIGDSHSNNGHNGDGGDQSNDAEMMILDTTMSVYPNDAGGFGPLLERESMVTQGITLSLDVSNNRLVWDNQSGEAGQLDSEYLYALNGQPDSEGPVNYDIYAGFNRTIGNPNRYGSGVTKVTITLGHFCDSVTEIPGTECKALVALYNSTAGHNWHDNSGWLDTNTPCSGWAGVTCSDGHVTILGLNANNLIGSIPPELGNLAKLKELWLFANQLSGNIPPELGNLTKLEEIELSANQLSGNIPPELGNLAKLKELWLHDNQLSGNIPASFGNLVELQNLYLNGNQELSGSLPATLTNLTLRDLHFYGTNLCEPQYEAFQDWLNHTIAWYGTTGLKCISEVCASVTEIPQTECEALVALYNSTSGDHWSNNTDYWGQTSTPCNWYGVTCSGGSVTDLGLAENQLSGNIPAELGNLVNLQHLYLNGNQELSGSLPANLTNLTSLQSFKFNDTNLCRPQDTTFQNWLADISYEGTGLVCTNYFGYEDWGGTWHDVDQNGDYGWAAVASNVLAWTEWGTSQLDSAEKILGDFRNYWTPGNGLMKSGWQWWFDGSTETPSGGGWTWAAVSGGGGHWLNYNFLDQYEYWGNWEAIQGIEHYLKNGYGVSITAYPDVTDPGHAFTVWGYESHPDGMITSLWMTDSADSEQKLDRFSLSYNPDISLWYINDGEYSGWHIGGVQALNRKDALNEPDTFVIAAISAPHGGISPEGNERVPQGQNKTFIVGHPSYSLQELLIDGDDKKVDCVPTGAGTCEYTSENVSENHTIQAIFLTEPEMITVKASAGTGGSILPNGDVKVAKGEDLTFTVTPGPRDPNKPEHPGYRIMDVLVDGKSRGPAITYTLPCFKLTESSLEALRNESGEPPEFDDLQFLKNQQFCTKEGFLEAVRAYMGPVKTAVYKVLILKHALEENREIEARFTEKTNLLAVVRKKCICLNRYSDGSIVEWEEGCGSMPQLIDAEVFVGDQVLGPEADQSVAPFSKSRALVLKMTSGRGDVGWLPFLLRWERADGTIVEEAISTEEDPILRPVIGCTGGAGKCHH